MNAPGKEGASSKVRGALFEEFADRYFPADVPAGEVDAKTAAEHAAMIAGTYSISRRMESNFFSLLGFIGQYQVTVNEDGTITSPLWPGSMGRSGLAAVVQPQLGLTWSTLRGAPPLLVSLKEWRTVSPWSAVPQS